MDAFELEADLRLSHVRDALAGLPFHVVDCSMITGAPHYEIERDWLDNSEPERIGFIGCGPRDTRFWYGGFFCTNEISGAKDNMREALSWLLNRHIDSVVGLLP